MMQLNQEMARLRDLMPASGRMNTRLVAAPGQFEVIKTPYPRPWKRIHPLLINFDLWQKLTEPQRDLLLLRQVAWIAAVNPLKIDIYQGVAAASLLGLLVELSQLDAIGVVTAGGLTALAGSQIWRNSRGSKAEIMADETALEWAERRGYAKSLAAQHLLQAVEAVARLEGRPNLSFNELLRCQNLRALAQLSDVTIPDELRS